MKPKDMTVKLTSGEIRKYPSSPPDFYRWKRENQEDIIHNYLVCDARIPIIFSLWASFWLIDNKYDQRYEPDCLIRVIYDFIKNVLMENHRIQSC